MRLGSGMDVVSGKSLPAFTRASGAASAQLTNMQAGFAVLSRQAIPAAENVNRLGSAFDAVGRRAVPALRSSLTSVTSQLLASQSGLSGANGAVSILTTGLYAINPVLGVVATAVSLLTLRMVKKKEAIVATTTVIDLNRTALSALAAENTSLGAKMEELRQKEIARITKQRDELKAWLDGQKEQSTTNQAAIPVWGALGGIMAMFTKEQEKANAATGTSDALRNQVLGTIQKLNDELKALNTTQNENAKITGNAAEELAKLNAANDDAVASMVIESLTKQAENSQRLLDIERERAQLRSQTASAGGDVFSIIAASNAVIAAEQAAYEQRLASANAFDGSRQVIEAQFTLFLEGELAKRGVATQRSLDAQAAAEKAAAAKELSAHKSKAALIEQLGTSHLVKLLTLQKVTAGEVIQGVADETRQFLAIKAVQWAAEAIAYAFTPGKQAEAAAKAKAAAMAGGGAIAISAIANQFGDRNEAGLGSIESSITSGAGSRSQSSGRTLVSQGPVTLYYSATFVVHGHVMDTSDIFNQFSLWNSQQLRAAAGDVSQRAR